MTLIRSICGDALLAKANKAGITLHAEPVSDHWQQLFDAERSLIACHAAPLRRATFSTGRYAAQHLLTQAGWPAQPLLRAGNGAIAWPDGAIGSLTHTDDTAVCALAVAAHSPVRALGIDLECIRPLNDRVAARISTAKERAAIVASDAHLSGTRYAEPVGVVASHTPSLWQPIALFSLRESLYKCLATEHADIPLRFHDVQFAGLDTAEPCFEFLSPLWQERCDPSAFRIHLCVRETQVFSLIHRS